MAITLKDVASVAGVSTATVSRALAGSERVAPQTANHIRMIADDLGYRFDNVARALRQKRSNLVGMVVPDYAFPGAPDFLLALNRELFQSEFVLAAVASFGSVENEFVQVERLLGQRVDALLIVPTDPIKSANAIRIALDEEIPVIQLHRPVQHPRTSSFSLDYVAGIDFALRFCGFRPAMTILYCDDKSSIAADSKREAFLSVMARRAHDNFQLLRLDTAPHVSSLGEPPNLIICDSYRIAEIVVQHYGLGSEADKRPSIVCLDSMPAKEHAAFGNVMAVEYPAYEMASLLVGWINRALTEGATPPENVLLQPFINLSRFGAEILRHPPARFPPRSPRSTGGGIPSELRKGS
ncbi:MAG: LacI family DNA-binding transcriptional regulator [Chloroflexi bacterium]|nr:LacI family DNA-binding transcriptional regulator [Chloroflexota bacterium]